MNRKLLLGLSFLMTLSVCSQETFNTTYFISKGRGDSLRIKMDKKFRYDQLNEKEKQRLIRSKFPPLHQPFSHTVEQQVNGVTVRTTKKIIITEQFYQNQQVIKGISAPFTGTQRFSVKLDESKGRLYLNPKYDQNLLKKHDDPDKNVYYIDLKNREYVWFPFTELTFTSLTIPLKYRFKNTDRGLPEDFTSAINLNFFLGGTYGNTKFIRREKIGDKVNTWKLTGGIILGTSTVTLNANNTTLATTPLAANESLTKGLFSLGFGGTYAFQNFNIGVFYGWDYSIGENANKWNYNREPWLGIGIGYSLFKL